MAVSIYQMASIEGRLPQEELLAQLAEECTELAHAALKKRRTLSAVNPTPVSESTAQRMLLEETADVLLLLALCGVDVTAPEIDLIQEQKAARWIARLKGDSNVE